MHDARRPSVARSLALLSALLASLQACSGSSTGSGPADPLAVVDESEPNGGPASADRFELDIGAHGTIASAADQDWWKLALVAGQTITLEVFALRLDQATWDAAGSSAGVRILDTDGVTELIGQGASAISFGANQDADVLTFVAPATGDYFVTVAIDAGPALGGDYVLVARAITLPGTLQLEIEPEGVTGVNDTDLSAQTIVPGAVLGYFVDDEQDWYEFSIAAPSLVELSIRSHRNGIWKGDDSPFDPQIDLFTAASVPLASNDDTFYLDSALHYVIETPGTYRVEVGECCGTGDGGYVLEYDLTPLSTFTQVAELEPNDTLGTAQTVQFDDWISGDVSPGATDMYALTCVAGDRLLVEIFDQPTSQGASDVLDVLVRDGSGNVLPSDLGNERRTLRTILTATDTYVIEVSSAGSTSYALHPVRVAATFESEPNDAALDAGDLDASSRVAGTIALAGDEDLFAFEATLGVPILLSCLADDVGPGGVPELGGFGSSLDPVLSVRDGTGTVVATADAGLQNAVGTNDGIPSVSLLFLPPSTGTFYASVADRNGGSGADFTYVLEKR